MHCARAATWLPPTTCWRRCWPNARATRLQQARWHACTQPTTTTPKHWRCTTSCWKGNPTTSRSCCRPPPWPRQPRNTTSPNLPCRWPCCAPPRTRRCSLLQAAWPVHAAKPSRRAIISQPPLQPKTASALPRWPPAALPERRRLHATPLPSAVQVRPCLSRTQAATEVLLQSRCPPPPATCLQPKPSSSPTSPRCNPRCRHSPCRHSTSPMWQVPRAFRLHPRTLPMVRGLHPRPRTTQPPQAARPHPHLLLPPTAAPRSPAPRLRKAAMPPPCAAAMPARRPAAAAAALVAAATATATAAPPIPAPAAALSCLLPAHQSPRARPTCPCPPPRRQCRRRRRHGATPWHRLQPAALHRPMHRCPWPGRHRRPQRPLPGTWQATLH